MEAGDALVHYVDLVAGMPANLSPFYTNRVDYRIFRFLLSNDKLSFIVLVFDSLLFIRLFGL